MPPPPGVAVNDCLFHCRILQDNDLRAVKRHSLEGLLLLKHLYVQTGSVPLPMQVYFIPPLFQQNTVPQSCSSDWWEDPLWGCGATLISPNLPEMGRLLPFPTG